MTWSLYEAHFWAPKPIHLFRKIYYRVLIEKDLEEPKVIILFWFLRFNHSVFSFLVFQFSSVFEQWLEVSYDISLSHMIRSYFDFVFI